jgi:serine protease
LAYSGYHNCRQIDTSICWALVEVGTQFTVFASFASEKQLLIFLTAFDKTYTDTFGFVRIRRTLNMSESRTRKVGFVALEIMLLGAIFVGCGGGSSSSSPSTYTVSGRIQAPDSAVIDSDVNDPAAQDIPNNDFGESQSLPNPAIVGGYVNTPGKGYEGRSFASGDPSDFFVADLTRGQTIELFVAEQGADLDLVLYDDNQVEVDETVGPSAVESLIVPGDGRYFIEVRSVDSASNYNLTIGITSLSTADRCLRLSDEFVPYEAIVRFADAQGAAAVASALGMGGPAGAAGREVLLRYAGDGEKQTVLRALGVTADDTEMQFADPQMPDKLDTLRIVGALRKRADVRYAEPNYIRRAFVVPDDAQYARQWNYPLINLPQAWEVTTGENTVIVAVVDTGVLLNHPDLAGRLVPGYDFISDPLMALDGDGIDPNPDDPGDESPGGSTFHGTHVAGTIAAATNNAIGVAGVTWQTQLMPVRALGRGGAGTVYDILQAVRYAAGLENDSGTLPGQKADIINLSLGGGGFSQTEQDVYTQVYQSGTIIVAAAGNQSTDLPTYPAGYADVVAVSAVDLDGEITWYSNFGPTIDVAAPGGDSSRDLNADGFPDGVLSTCGDDSSGSIRFVYCFLQGTSMAAPHVAGVAALLKAVYPALTPEEFDVLLAAGSITEDLGTTGRDNFYGNGLIDALAAVAEGQQLAGGAALPPIILAKPAALNLIATGSRTATLTISNGGDDPEALTIDSLTSDAPWMTVAPDDVNDHNLGTYTVTIDLTDLEVGAYSAAITVQAVEANVDALTVPVNLQVVGAVVGGNAGFQYVLLVDPDSLEVKAQDAVAFNGTGYDYRFTGVAAGTYKIFAGTDSNNDGLIGDPGEAFGAYLTVDQPVSIHISQDTANLDFTTGFAPSLASSLGAGHGSARIKLQRRGFRTLGRKP